MTCFAVFAHSVRALLVAGHLAVLEPIDPSNLPDSPVPQVETVIDVFPMSGELAKASESTLEHAIRLVREHIPPSVTNSLFHWTGDPQLVENKSVHIILTTSNSPKFFTLLRENRQAAQRAVPDNAMAFTGRFPRHHETAIYIVFLVDRIFKNHSSDHALAKMTAALAHIVFGRVQDYLETPIGRSLPSRHQIRTAQLTVEFLESLIGSSDFDSLSLGQRHQFSEELQIARKTLHKLTGRR